MTTALIKIIRNDASAIEDAREAALRAVRMGEFEGYVVSFATPGQFFEVFTTKRLELLDRLQELGPSSLRGLARSLGRDVKRVHGDIAAMIEWGFVHRDQKGKYVVPFDRIHADIDLKSARNAAA